jgi:tripartite-type tricarboxylate transporter receptor subunit TctC
MSTVNRLSACLAISLLAISDASPQISTVKIVVRVPPGGANDFLARVLVEQIGRAQGPAFTIENRTGAGGIIAAEAVSRSATDGRTLLIDSNSLLIDALVQKTNYHPLTELRADLQSGRCAVRQCCRALSQTGDLIDAARAKPREITLATLGPGGPFRIGYERLRRAANAARRTSRQSET